MIDRCESKMPSFQFICRNDKWIGAQLPHRKLKIDLAQCKVAFPISQWVSKVFSVIRQLMFALCTWFWISHTLIDIVMKIIFLLLLSADNVTSVDISSAPLQIELSKLENTLQFLMKTSYSHEEECCRSNFDKILGTHPDAGLWLGSSWPFYHWMAVKTSEMKERFSKILLDSFSFEIHREQFCFNIDGLSRIWNFKYVHSRFRHF